MLVILYKILGSLYYVVFRFRLYALRLAVSGRWFYFNRFNAPLFFCKHDTSKYFVIRYCSNCEESVRSCIYIRIHPCMRESPYLSENRDNREMDKDHPGSGQDLYEYICSRGGFTENQARICLWKNEIYADKGKIFYGPLRKYLQIMCNLSEISEHPARGDASPGRNAGFNQGRAVPVRELPGPGGRPLRIPFPSPGSNEMWFTKTLSTGFSLTGLLIFGGGLLILREIRFRRIGKPQEIVTLSEIRRRLEEGDRGQEAPWVSGCGPAGEKISLPRGAVVAPLRQEIAFVLDKRKFFLCFRRSLPVCLFFLQQLLSRIIWAHSSAQE